ncbi:hypothetical protein [Streptomyces sp. NPDC017202]|uniref:hypothetical protein n=1 Tax=Streptomyces sp. NPDC017202 TaxID=3364981 RepID=UPI00379264D5
MAGAPRGRRGGRRPRREPAAGTVPRPALRQPRSTLAVSAAVRPHGIRPHPRGLPVPPRADRHETPEDTA